MADQLTSEQAESLKRTTAYIDQTRENLRVMAKHITLLLGAGRATCAQLKAYNLFAISIYETQRGMLAQLRAQNVAGLPESVPAPTLFAWKGVPGEKAILFDCGSGATAGSLAGAMFNDDTAPQLLGALREATQPASAANRFVSSADVKVLTTDQNFLQAKAPSLAELTTRLTQTGELGLGPLTIVIVGLFVVLGVLAAVRLYGWYAEMKISENSAKVSANYTTQLNAAYKTATSCLEQCIATGSRGDACAKACDRLVPDPQAPGQVAPTNTLTTVGYVALAGLALYGGWRAWAWWTDRSAGAYAGARRPGRRVIDIDEDGNVL